MRIWLSVKQCLCVDWNTFVVVLKQENFSIIFTKKYILRKVQAIIWILFHIYLLLTVGPLITLTPLSIYKSKVPHWSSQHLTWLLNNNRCIYSYNVAVRKTWKSFSQKLLQKLVLKLPKSILKRNTLQLTCIFKKKNDFCINSGNRVNTVCSSVLVTRAIDFCCYATYGIYTNSIDLLL